MGIGAGLFATLLMIPLYAAANPSGEALATAPKITPASFDNSTSAAPIWIVKMNDDDPMYRPNSVEITAGQTVEWQNDGQVSHSVTDDPARADQPADALLPAGVKPFNSGNVMPGGRFRHTFTQPGRYRYFCLTHEGDKMVGEVIVQPSSTVPQPQVAKSKPAVASPSPPTELSSSAPVQIVKMNDDDPMYRPNTIEIGAGETVEWENDGQVSHSVIDDPTRANRPADALLPAGARPFDSGNVMPGARFRHTFMHPGRYRYFCLSHEADRMIGEIIVGPAAHRHKQQLATSSHRTPPLQGSLAALLKVVTMHDGEAIHHPSPIQIASGQTIEWKNDGQISYSISDDPSHAWDPVDAMRPPGSRPFTSGSIVPGGKFRHTFTEPGRYRYFCPTPAGDRMVGEVIVRPAENGEASQSTEDVDGLSAVAHRAITE